MEEFAVKLVSFRKSENEKQKKNKVGDKRERQRWLEEFFDHKWLQAVCEP